MHAKNGPVDDGVLEVEAGQVVADPDAVRNRKEPVVPVALAIVCAHARLVNIGT